MIILFLWDSQAFAMNVFSVIGSTKLTSNKLFDKRLSKGQKCSAWLVLRRDRASPVGDRNKKMFQKKGGSGFHQQEIKKGENTENVSCCSTYEYTILYILSFQQRSYSINANVRPSVCMFFCLSVRFRGKRDFNM